MRLLVLLLAGFCFVRAEAASVRQMILSIAPDWNSRSGILQKFDLIDGQWRPNGGPVPVLYGPHGLAWGRGLKGADEPGLKKRERDGRAPAGLFELGKIYTYDSALPAGADYPFLQVGPWDAWVDDVTLPSYNRHVRVDSKNPPVWFEKQKMRHNDFAYRWLVEIRHNADPPLPGAGSAIFFHIRRGSDRPSAGCTVMEERELVDLVRWLRAEAKPRYALLTAAEYEGKWKRWGLPGPQASAALLTPAGKPR